MKQHTLKTEAINCVLSIFPDKRKLLFSNREVIRVVEKAYREGADMVYKCVCQAFNDWLIHNPGITYDEKNRAIIDNLRERLINVISNNETEN